MAQDYEILDVRAGDQWDSQYGPMQTYALALKGFGEPVKLNKKVPVRDEPQKGGTLYGTIEEKTSKNGSRYYQFKAERPDSSPYSGHSSSGPKREYQPRDDAAIKAQWAIGQAMVWTTHTAAGKDNAFDVMETTAKKLYAMVDRVKAANTGSQGVVTSQDATNEPQNPPAASGYEKFQQSRPTAQAPADTDDTADFSSMLSKGLEADGINLDDIPL